ncbi:hypothetical protein [Thalassobellus suaedae]|uniref:Uncharacterized protein n=1 Tax=Thalassobellus suaedae TaxID=3074124 RepID=A0ABY9XXM1_9FLAO|nr:hypothetical protein RHP51_07350 [Flavobacteriaceae bacterium HL-DH14]WNH12441.1 hypothetical protein RHP49_16325 [Flavobacteriaceae bacterium HL-DH10]
MKNFIQTLVIFLLVIGNIFAQQEKGIIGTNNWLYNWTEFKPSQNDYGEPTQILAGNITEDLTLSKRDIYLLLGDVFVTNNATLTIEPGTIIIGDYDSKASLTISKGATIIADGLETDPIVFTSSRSVKRAGDWGGLILLGDAPTNKFGNGSVSAFYSQLAHDAYANTNYGGDNYQSNSGVLRYVRIEYAGKRIKAAGYFNGLLLASVGSETVFENIMISHSAGDSFEILGGDVCLNKVVSYKSNSNDFKFNFGAKCKLNNSLAIRSPYISSNEGSRCIQVLSFDKKEQVDFTKNGTEVVAKNLTLLNDSDNLKSDINMGLVKEAIFIGENASLDMDKSVISGFNPAVLFEDEIQINQDNLEKIKFANMYFNNCNGNIFIENNSNNEDLENWYGNSAFYNVYSKSDNSETFIDINNSKRPDFRLRINKIIASKDHYASEDLGIDD